MVGPALPPGPPRATAACANGPIPAGPGATRD